MKRLADWLGRYEPLFRNLARLAVLVFALYALDKWRAMEATLASAAQYEARIEALEQAIEDLTARLEEAESQAGEDGLDRSAVMPL